MDFTTGVLIVAAYLTSTVSGFLGMAGGISLLGVMTAVVPAGQVVPIHGAVQLASNFTRTIIYIRHVVWKVFLIYCVPVTFGVAAATAVWSGEKLEYFKPGIGGFILLFLIWRRLKPKLKNIPFWAYAPLGLASGFLTIFVGATGPFIAPFFLRDDFKKEQVIATKAVCQAWGHFLKIPAFMALGFPFHEHRSLMAVLFVCVFIGTLAGRWLLDKIDKKRFLLMYEGVLAVIAVFLILGPTPA